MTAADHAISPKTWTVVDLAFIKLLFFGLVGLSLIYWLVSIYSRSVRREKLEKQWDADPDTQVGIEGRDAFIERGLKEYERGFRKKLILLVYIVPVVLIVTIFIITNFT